MDAVYCSIFKDPYSTFNVLSGVFAVDITQVTTHSKNDGDEEGKGVSLHIDAETSQLLWYTYSEISALLHKNLDVVGKENEFCNQPITKLFVKILERALEMGLITSSAPS